MTTATTAATGNGTGAHAAPTQPVPIDTNTKIINHLAEKLRGIDIINGACVAVETTVHQGIIDVTVTQVAFNGDDATVRVILHPTTPVPIDPPPALRTTTDTGADPLTAGNDK